MTQTQTDRIITNPDEGFVTCTKLQVTQKLLDLPKMQDVVGGSGMVVRRPSIPSLPLPPPIQNIIININNSPSPGPGGAARAAIVTAGAAVVAAAGTWKEEIKEGADAVIDFVSDLFD